MSAPRLTATVLYGLRSVFEACDLPHFHKLYDDQPLEDQAAQVQAYAWLCAIQDYRQAHDLACYPPPHPHGRPIVAIR